MAQFPSQDRGPAGPADGIGTEHIIEPDALIGQPVYVGCLKIVVIYTSIGGDGMGGMIITHDVYNIGFQGYICLFLRTTQ